MRPDVRYHETFMAAHFEFRDEFRNADGSWGAPACESGYPGISFTRAEMNTPEGFERFVRWRLEDALDETPRPKVQVPTTHLWIIDDETQEYLGSVHIRHRLTDFLQDMGGHVSYSVRPSARGRGVASEALREGLQYAAEQLGFERLLVTTTQLNKASARVIEHNGGVLEDVSRGMLRYWIATTEGGVALPPSDLDAATTTAGGPLVDATAAGPLVDAPAADPTDDVAVTAEPLIVEQLIVEAAPQPAGPVATPAATLRDGPPERPKAATGEPLLHSLLSRIGLSRSRSG